MKRKPIVIVTLFIIFFFILPVGNLLASGTLIHSLYLSLVLSNAITATPVITETPTPTAQPIPDVIINYIKPGGYRDEYVRVKNRTNETVELTGWTIRSLESGEIYSFPEFNLRSNDAVQVWTKPGTDTEKDLYWGEGTGVWDNDGDCARLGDYFDRFVQWYCYSSTTPTPPTPTVQPIPDVIINHIEPGNYYAEYVRVKNRSDEKVELTDWTIKSDKTDETYTFPEFKLRPNDAVKVWSTSGTNTDTDLYWGAWTEVWDDDDDCARLGDDNDEFVDWYCYE